MVKENIVFCPPPPAKRQKAELQHGDKPNDTENRVEEEPEKLYEFHYSKYLELVVQILESQPKFQERLKGMNEQDIKAGKIADHLDELDQEVFDKLTKAKVEEVERLRAVVEEQIKKDGDAKNVQLPEHLDVNDWQKFGKEDLRKLIQKTVADMNKIDEGRKQKFKEYEMEKKALEDHKLAEMSPEAREREKKELEGSKKRHQEHEPLKHPGGKDQLEEVWEERDHMDKDSFDPKSFFNLHDLNGDGHWNDEEIEALFQIQLEKVYNETSPDDDPKEKIEEMYRMREHVVKQMDKNGDRLISLQEFLQDTEAQAPEGTKDEGWQDIGAQKIYTDEELAQFEKEYGKQKGWGEHAYDPVSSQQQMPNQHQQPDDGLGQNAPIVHSALPPQQREKLPSGKVPKVDPVYGI
uniref:EF-hand domain-containing protein n=1 Tax=Globodera pallida TaxID=36090 RepID=A0A183CKA1_GLOPA